ncbi:hypothetical protein D3C81_2160690 [compost metagenome]
MAEIGQSGIIGEYNPFTQIAGSGQAPRTDGNDITLIDDLSSGRQGDHNYVKLGDDGLARVNNSQQHVFPQINALVGAAIYS